MGFEVKEVNVDYSVNDSVKILDGALRDFVGTVTEINKEKHKVKVLVSMFGRETPVELEFSQVEKYKVYNLFIRLIYIFYILKEVQKMAEKEIGSVIKLQIPAGKASPAPPVGPALGGTGVNIMQFVKEFNDRTANLGGVKIPVVLTVYKDKTFEFITKEPPMAVLIKKAAKIEKASGKPNREKVATITKAQVEEIAKQKMPDLNAASLESAMSMVAGTARSMGVIVAE